MAAEDQIPRKSSKTPAVFGIMEVATHPHYSKQRRLSSECQCPQQTAATQAKNSPPYRESSRSRAGTSHDRRFPQREIRQSSDKCLPGEFEVCSVTSLTNFSLIRGSSRSYCSDR